MKVLLDDERTTPAEVIRACRPGKVIASLPRAAIAAIERHVAQRSLMPDAAA